MSDEGSEDLPARPKRKIKRIVVMSSSSSSESDESIVVAGTRRNRLRVVSEDDSESSGSPVICPGTRHKRTLPKLRDSDVESDSSGWETDYSASAKPAPTSTKSQSGFASDSSEGNSEKCSICLMRFTNQEVGTPQNCDHIFCLDCITEWSKNVNTCPVDRISFDSIVVRVCAGGRVVRTEQVHVVERRPSVEWMVVEDPTLCEICQRGDNEESMLLCDGCDRGFHMQCLRPPITRVPIDQWLCPNCIYHVIQIELAGVDEIFNDMSDQETAQQPSEGVRNTRRSSRTTNSTDQPSTSSGSRGRNSNQDEIPTTSNGRQRTHRTAQVSTVARRSTGHRKKPRRRRTKTVIIEYEVQGDGKFPITKTVKRKVKRRKVKRKQSRAASRRRHVLASVRARMQALRPSRPAPRGPAPPLHRGPDIAPRLSLYGDPMQLDYFSDDEERDRTSGGVAAVAVRPSSSVISSFRQARRKMITINSPPHATTAPDILSSILESQTLLHSKNSVVEISVDGNVNIKLQKEREKRRTEMKSSEKVDLSKVEDATRKVPSYGQHRGGGGGRAGGHRASARTPAGPAAGQRPATGGHRPAGLRSAAGPSAGRGDESAAPYQRRPPAAWPLYSHRPPPHRPPPHRPRALATDDPIDMRVAPLAERHHSYGPLPEPPVFKFDKTPDGDNSEDERSDSGLIIDTEKYDPTEPTNDESGDDSPVPGPAPAARGPPAGGVAVSPEVLSSAVRQVLNEHRQLVVNEHRHLSREEPSDEDEDGDCPNFSIYSATSVHIAAEGGAPAPAPAAPPAPSDDLADLVQEDDSPERAAPPAPVDPIKKKPEDEYKEKVSKRCPITTNTRNPIKIKLNSTSLIKRQVSLYDEEEPVDDVESADIPETDVKTADVVNNKEVVNITNVEKELEKNNTFVPLDENSKLSILEDEQILEESVTSPSANKVGNHVEEITDTCKSPKDNGTETGNESATDKGDDDAFNKKDEANDDDDYNFENDINSNDEISEGEFPPARNSRRNSEDKNEEGVEKMTESISETEDERSYTPCLDENKSKDNSFETEKDRGLEGLDTEMISEDEGNEMFSEEEKPASERRTSPVLPPVEENGVPEKRQEDARKKKRKESKRDSKRDGKDKKSKTRKSVIGFKKLSKNGKERNYRDKDKERRDSSDGEKKRKRKEKRKDLERYDVRTVVTEKRRKTKDPFGRDVSPRSRSPTASPARRRRTASGSPVRRRRSPTASPGRRRRSASVSPVRRRRSASVSPVRRRRSASGSAVRLSPAGRRGARRREGERGRKRRRAERSPSPRPKPKPAKRRKRPRSEKRRKSPKRRRTRVSPAGEQSPREASPAEGGAAEAWTSPRTPPPAPPEPARHRPRHRRPRSATGPSKEVFTSGDNILVSVSFKEQERTSDSPERRERRLRRRERRRRRRAAAGLQAGSAPGGLPPAGHAPAGLAPAGHAPVGPALASLATARPVAIIDLERSPFRELTPSPRNVIVLSDSEQGGAEVVSEVVSSVAGGEAPAVEVPPPVEEAPPTASPPPEDSRGPNTPPDPPSSPDAYDPFEPTRSRSASPEPAAMTLEAAQRTNLSADQLLARRPLSPAEKVMALLQSTRDVSPEPPPAAENSPVAGGAPAVVAAVAAAVGVAAVGGATAGGAGPGSPPAEPRPVVRRPSPIKSEPIKPLPTRRSPSSPGSSDFGDLFEPPAKRDAFDAVKRPNNRPNKLFRKKGGKMQVGVKIDDDNLKILDELPNSAVEMQVKSKFLKKLNRQERVVEEVKLVLKPHFNRKRVTKDEYKDILRRAVPKICHNKSGEINPTKIQALVEAYVKKFQKRHKLGLA